MEQKIRSSGSHKITNEIVFRLITDNLKIPSRILDYGAGSGYMCQRLGHHILSLGGVTPEACLSACDIFPENFKYDRIKCVKVERINSSLPFHGSSFDLVYAIEVLEHLRRPYDFFEEVFRILRPGGKILFTVPNTLHVVSRLSFLFYGFYDMYLPPSSDIKNSHRICGHIMPLNYAYYASGLRAAGFKDISLHFDRYKRSAIGLLLGYPIFKIASALYKRKIQKYDEKVYEENRLVLKEMNSVGLLCSRSCIVLAVKGA